MKGSFEIVIVGNGCLGMTLAWEISRLSPSTRVAVVGPAARSGSASMAAGAMINVWAELEAGALEDPALADRASLARRALPLWDQHAAELSEATGVAVLPVWGTWVISSPAGSAHEEEAFDYLLDVLAAQGVTALTTGKARPPFLGARPSARAMRVARVPDGRVDSHAAMFALDAVLTRHSNTVCVDDVVRGLSSDCNRGWRVHLDRGIFLCAHHVVLANGAYAQAIVETLPALRATVPPLLFGTGFALDVAFQSSVNLPAALADLTEVVRTMDRGGGCGLHLIPGARGSRRYYVGATSAVSLTPETCPRVHALGGLISGLVDEFHESFFHAQVTIRPAGHRPVSMDAFPLLGQSAIEGIWFCNGTKRDGFTCAPVLARELAHGLLGGRYELPERFRPSRKLITYRTRAEAIARATAGTIGSDEMRGLRLPSFRRDEWVEHERERVTAIYDRRCIDGFGIHPELLHLYDSDAMHARISHPRERE